MVLNRSQQIIVFFLALSILIYYSGADYGLLPAAFFVTWIIHIINSLGAGLIIRHVFVLMLALQYCMGPTLSYAFNVNPTYAMVLPDKEYFDFAFTGVLLLSLGIFSFTSKSDEDSIFKPYLQNWESLGIDNKLMEKFMFFSLITDLIPFSPPEALNFVFLLIFSLKYAYVCYVIIINKKINYYYLAIPILFLTYLTIRTAMFHDLVTWSIFWGISICIRIKPTKLQIISAMIGFFVLIVAIQITKQTYRTKAWDTAGSGISESGISTYGESLINSTETLDEGSLAENISRINQAWITCRVIEFVPKYIDHEGADLIEKYIEAAFLPRLIAPDKLTAGNKELFGKYTGIKLQGGTSMGLGILSDAWICFGLFGGWMMLFCYGLIISLSLKYFERMIAKIPLLYFFLPLVYYYPIRPDCETQTAFGHLIKTIFFITVVSQLFLGKIKKMNFLKDFK